MGREVRRVPPDWQHPEQDNPRDRRGESPVPLFAGRNFKPIFELKQPFAEVLAEWQRGLKLWLRGEHPTQIEYRDRGDRESYMRPTRRRYEEWDAGPAPLESDYMPYWPPEQRTHWQMYECTTEGTPISPVFATPEKLARWLAENAEAWGDGGTYEEWLSMIDARSAPTFVVQDGEVKPGFKVKP